MLGLMSMAGWLVQGCASKPPPKKFLTVDVQAAANVNPNANGRPSPVAVRVYELKAVAQFRSESTRLNSSHQ